MKGQPDDRAAEVGADCIRSERRGDQLVAVKVAVPTQLTPKQKKLLEELGETLGTPKLGDERGFFDKLAGAFSDAFGS